MDPRTEPICICGHMEGYHGGVSYLDRNPPHRWHWCCAGNWKTGRRACRCPRFRLAIAQVSNRDGVENSDPS